jgi:hypothetical protein
MTLLASPSQGPPTMSITPEEHAAALIGYFDRCAAETPGDNKWQLGAEMAREWLRLIKVKKAAPEEVAALIKIVDTYARSGSGWFDLACGVSDWATSNGFSIPYPLWPHRVSEHRRQNK